jgi:hypothetical protein
MGLDTKTYWLTDRQSQCNIDSDIGVSALSCGGGVEYLHRNIIMRQPLNSGI